MSFSSSYPSSYLPQSNYKSHKTSRGYTYSYYFAKPQSDNKPTLIFLHGFPSTSNDWRYEVKYFESKGYGLIVPDMLGYGGTDKPGDDAGGKEYVGSGLAKDVVDLMDSEGVEKGIVVGHDWGSRVASRALNYYPSRFTAAAFLAVGYTSPNPGGDWNQMNGMLKGLLGRELLGYQSYFSEPGTDKILEKNFDSFFSLFMPEDSKTWIDHVGPTGATKAWIEGNNQGPTVKFLTEEDKEYYKRVLLEGGMRAPLGWYRAQTSGAASEDDKNIPKENYDLSVPIFFGAALKDYICIPALFERGLQQHAKGKVTKKEFDADHWLISSHKEEISEALEEWIIAEKL